MKQTIRLFQIGLRQIMRDGMLFALIPAPVMIGLLFRLGIPFVNRAIEEKLSFSLLPWYGLVDGLLICLTPMLTAMITAFLLLEERDEGISAFYQVTPTAGYSYMVARIGFPMAWAILVTSIITLICRLSGLSVMAVLCCALVSTLMGIALAMMVVTIASNRVEGLALSKLMGISLLGLVAVWAVPAPYAYLAAFLPSFWIGRIIAEGLAPFSLAMALSLCAIWIFIFTRRFLTRLA